MGMHFYPAISPSIVHWTSFAPTMSINILITMPMRSRIDKGVFHILIVSFTGLLIFSVPQHLEISTSSMTCPVTCSATYILQLTHFSCLYYPQSQTSEPQYSVHTPNLLPILLSQCCQCKYLASFLSSISTNGAAS